MTCLPIWILGRAKKTCVKTTHHKGWHKAQIQQIIVSFYYSFGKEVKLRLTIFDLFLSLCCHCIFSPKPRQVPSSSLIIANKCKIKQTNKKEILLLPIGLDFCCC